MFRSDPRRIASGAYGRAEFAKARSATGAPRQASELPPPCVDGLYA